MQQKKKKKKKKKGNENKLRKIIKCYLKKKFHFPFTKILFSFQEFRFEICVRLCVCVYVYFFVNKFYGIFVWIIIRNCNKSQTWDKNSNNIRWFQFIPKGQQFLSREGFSTFQCIILLIFKYEHPTQHSSLFCTITNYSQTPTISRQGRFSIYNTKDQKLL